MLFLIFFLSGCTNTVPHGKAADSVIFKFANSARRSQNLRLLAYGGAFLDDIKEFSFEFCSFRKMDLNEARTLLVENVEGLLNLINSDQSLMLYLHEFPFNYKRIEFSILFSKKKHHLEFVETPFVAAVTVRDGMVSYQYYDFSTSSLETLHAESYLEACELSNIKKI